MLEIIVVGLIGLITSFISNISGGGGALMLMPALLHVGLSPLTAVGTIKVGSLGLVAGSITGSKNKQVVRKEYFIPMLAIVTVASIIGPRLIIEFSEVNVKLLSSILIVITALLSITTWRRASESRQVTNLQRNTGYFLYFVCTVVLAGIGSGVGIISNYVLIGLLGMSALETIATRRAAGLIGVPLQFLAFAISGHIDYKLGIALLIGSTIGGYIGMHTAIKQGSEFIKRVMAVVSIGLVFSLFI